MRHFLLALLLTISVMPAPQEVRAAEPTGLADERLAGFDEVMTSFMEKWHLPGGALAVSRNGKLVYSRGYGLADVDAGEPVTPNALFRLASLSKPVTAVAVLKLVQDGRLSLDDRAFTILADHTPPNGLWGDERIEQITIRQLLRHTEGWNRDEDGDPVFPPITRTIANELGVPHPPTCAHVIRYMAGRPLDFAPDAQFGYSNLGYCVLGRVIERVTGRTYEEFVRQNVLDPAGASGFRLARTAAEDRQPGEVRYYPFPGQGSVRSVLTNQSAPAPYGGFYAEGFDSFAGWVASAPDYLRFANAIDGQRGPALLTPETLALLTERPVLSMWEGTPMYYGLGWWIRPVSGGFSWWHLGSLAGTSTLVTKLNSGVSWTMFFNSRSQDRLTLGRELASALQPALRGITDWPEVDLFQ